MKINEKEFIWAEKYRPSRLEDLIFPEKLKKKISEWLKTGEIPNIGIFGSVPGTGKSSLLNVLINEIGTDTMWINGSKETGVDTFRNKVDRFASTISINGKFKLIVIDEADYLSQNAQALLRGDIEETSANARFLFTGNYTERIIDALLNRLQIFDLDQIYQDDKKELASQIVKRLIFILENENIKYNKKDVAEVVKSFYPSTRKMIMYLQQNSLDGQFKFSGITKSDEIYEKIVEALKGKKFNSLRKYVNEMVNPETFYTYLWKNMDTIFEKESQPNVIVWLATYQDMSQRAKNKQIPLMALFVNIIGDQNMRFVDA